MLIVLLEGTPISNKMSDIEKLSLEGERSSEPTIIGIYGIPGSGKSHLLNELKVLLGEKDLLFIDSSDVLEKVTPRGIAEFKLLDEATKAQFRELASVKIADEAAANKKAAVVTGHLMFWTEGEAAGTSVCTPMDFKVYTHILYFDIAPETIANRRGMDSSRVRPRESVDHLAKWQKAVKDELRGLCYDSGVLFSVLDMNVASTEDVAELLQDLIRHDENFNMSVAIGTPGSRHEVQGRDQDYVSV